MVAAERSPVPSRTKRGRGDGARLDLTIHYHVAEGNGDVYGSLSGRDARGPWELQFANESDRDEKLNQVLGSLQTAAAKARADVRAREGARTVWLKAIGAATWPADRIWWDERRRDEGINFPYRPRSVRPGDLLVIYAVGTGRVVGVLEVAGEWYYDGTEERWPYRVDTRVLEARTPEDGIPLDSISDERAIGKSIRQKSHIRLSEAEAETALSALGVGRDASPNSSNGKA